MQHFASAPQAVSGNRKYRSPDETVAEMGAGGSNIMHDKRVCRGNTHASLAPSQPDASEVRKQREAQRRRLMRANQTKKRAGTPDPVAGRKHMDIQTDSYLEELTERTVEFEAETQTDFLLDRPPSPLFMPAKIGVDIDTQIEEGELFDFDVECEPVLEVLVGKTLEQSMMEVLEEEELASLRRYQEEFEKRRNAELLEAQRMEAAEKRRSDEMERRLQQQAAQKERDMSTMRKVVSRSVANAHLASIRDRALAHLMDAGLFADSVQLAVDNHFMPSLLKAVQKEIVQATQDRAIIASVMETAISKQLATHESRLEVERRRIAAIDQAEREAREEKAQEQKARDEEAARIEAEQEVMMEWERFVPEPPAPEPELRVKEVNGDNMAVCGDEDIVATVPEDKLEELRGILARAAEANQVRAEGGEEAEAASPENIVIGRLAAAQDGVEGRVLEEFRAGTLADLAGAAEGGEAVAGEAAA